MSDRKQTNFPLKVQSALFRRSMIASGRHDAFLLARKLEADLDALRREVKDTEEILNDPDLINGPMKPGAGPQIYREGYLDGLRETIELIERLNEE